jgi:phage portal protein BeeE
MGILQGIFKPRDKPSQRHSAKNLGGSSFLWGNSSAGKVVNEHTAMQMTAVYSCVRILSEAIAGFAAVLCTNTARTAARKSISTIRCGGSCTTSRILK